MAESKHGGSPASGLVLPAGIEQHSLTPGGLVVPEIARKAEEARERARQFERRRLALEALEIADRTAHEPAMRNGTIGAADYDAGAAVVKESLRLADLLIAQTGGVV